MADKQPPNNQAMRKLPITPLPTTAYTTKTSKQKKTKEEKQLDRAALRGGALEASWSAADREGEGPGSCTCSNFQAKSTLFSVLLTAALNGISNLIKASHVKYHH